MELTSNAERQARFRKKDQLKRLADQILHNWQHQPWHRHPRSFQDAQYLIAKAIELPSGWTDEDYQAAEIKLNEAYIELSGSVNKIPMDVRENSNFSVEFMRTPDPFKLGTDLDKSIENTNALASHLISALKISTCNEADQAAALMEAARFLGLALATNREVPCSPATAMCLATIGPQNSRPNWFAEKLASTLSQQLDKNISGEVGKYLIKKSIKEIP